MEVCIGCMSEAPQHPMVAVVHNGEQFVSQPVCLRCHENPAHRLTVIKGHFFPREHRTAAVVAAGSQSIKA